MKAFCALLPLIFLGGCANRAIQPYLGKWNGGFVVEGVSGETGKELARNNLNGYLQIYATNRKFDLYLAGEQETVPYAQLAADKELSQRVKQALDAKQEGGAAGALLLCRT